MAVTSTNNLRLGSTGDDVLELQKLLNSAGNYNLAEDGSFGENTLAAVKDYQTNNGLEVDGIVGTNTWGKLTSGGTSATTPTTPTTPTETPTTEGTGFTYQPYQKSDTVAQAEAMLKEQLAQKPGSYTSAWQTQLDETLNKILNREKFSYDLNGDALYQQYKDQYTTQGKMAMMDTMGQAQAMTGGYGNSYAQSVGQQTYQGYLQQLNDRVPELYQLAMDQYNREGDEMYNHASLMASMEEQDYGRYRDQVGDYYTELDRLTEDARYQGEQDYGKWADKLNLEYGMYRDQVADKQWQAEFDEAKRQYDQQYELQNKKPTTSNPSNPGTKYTAPDGWTKSDIEEFQQKYNLKVDGLWGPESEAKYKEVYGNGGTGEDYSDWDQGDWEHYFSAIRQSDGQAAAEEELNEFVSKGLIPQNMIYYGRIGASGKLGH